MSLPLHGREMNRDQFYSAMRGALLQLRSTYGAGDGLDDDTVDVDDNLFDRGLLTSLTVASLIAILEHWSGAEIDVERYGMEGFFTLRSLYIVFEEARRGYR